MNQEIQRCIRVLKAGGSILYPTDTIWGIGCDATNPFAVSKVYDIKQRVDSKAMLVLVDSIEMISDYVEEIPEMALKILKTRIKPGPVQVQDEGSVQVQDDDSVQVQDEGSVQVQDDRPLTIVYPGARGLAGNLLSEDGSIGIRITTEAFSKRLIKTFGKPLVSSSANIAGKPPPSNFLEISDGIRSAVDYVANWNRAEQKKRKPSGILKVSLNGEIKIIRP